MQSKVNFRNLLLARESRGITQTNMAKAIEGLNQGNLSKMEKGLLPISEDILTKIAVFLDYPTSFFYKQSQNRELNSFFYRKRVTISSKAITQLEAKFDLTRIAIDELLDSVDIPEFSIPSIPVSERCRPDEIADRIRIYFGLSRGPIEKITALLESHGVIVIFIKDAPEKFFGVTMFTNKSQPVVFINEDLSNDAKRFTLGHELGHLVMHLRENNTYQKDEKELDREADMFSSEFNMPEEDCKNDLFRLKYKDLPTIKAYWKLSKSAICYKAKSMGVLGDSQYRYFMMQLSSSGQRKKENEYVDIDEPTLLEKIVDVHINNLHYSFDELSEMIGISTNDIQSLLPHKEAVRPKFRIIKSWS